MWTWDEPKRQANLAKHGVDFSSAPLMDWSGCVFGLDLRREYGEIRIVATGMLGQRLHVLTYTLRGESIRVISLRKANEREFQRWTIRGS